jgi:hypothetical protein
VNVYTDIRNRRYFQSSDAPNIVILTWLLCHGGGGGIWSRRRLVSNSQSWSRAMLSSVVGFLHGCDLPHHGDDVLPDAYTMLGMYYLVLD